MWVAINKNKLQAFLVCIFGFYLAIGACYCFFTGQRFPGFFHQANIYSVFGSIAGVYIEALIIFAISIACFYLARTLWQKQSVIELTKFSAEDAKNHRAFKAPKIWLIFLLEIVGFVLLLPIFALAGMGYAPSLGNRNYFLMIFHLFPLWVLIAIIAAAVFNSFKKRAMAIFVALLPPIISASGFWIFVFL